MGLIGRVLGLRENGAVSMALEEKARSDAQVEILTESLADLELAMDDVGWKRIIGEAEHEFTREGLQSVARIARVFAVSNPLIHRGLSLRQAYVFGQGCEIQARAGGEEDGQQDVNEVIQAFVSDEGNKASVFGDQASGQLERALGTDGNVFIAAFTNPRTGRVQVRTILFDEIDDVITNPQDRDDPWFYKRVWTETSITDLGRIQRAERTDYYPALGHYPANRPRTLNGDPVHWDTPVYHVKVNDLLGWKFGIGDAYPALSWARAYKDFLADWAVLMKSLSQFAWRATTKGSKAQKMRQAMQRRPSGAAPAGNENNAGATAVVGEGNSLEAIPKTGATIDSESGRPLATMVASAMDVPVTTLLSDPGQTGARAVAETLNFPTRLGMELRQKVWAEAYRALCHHVITEAVRAPGGQLQGRVVRDPATNRASVILAGDDNGDDTTIEVNFPDLSDVPVDIIVKAIVEADGTGKLPPVETLKLLLRAFNIRDAEDIIENATDDEGNWIDPDATAGQAAVNAFRRGEDPAEAVR